MLRAAAVLFLATTVSCGAKSEVAALPAVPMYRPSPTATIPFRIVFESQMSSMFQFQGIDLRLDGGRVLTEAQHEAVVERVGKGERAQLDVRLEPGDHVIRAVIVFRGSGKGNASYLNGYKFEIRTSRSSTAAPAGIVTIVAYEQDGPIEERPAVRYVEANIPAPPKSSSGPCPAPSAQ